MGNIKEKEVRYIKDFVGAYDLRIFERSDGTYRFNVVNGFFVDVFDTDWDSGLKRVQAEVENFRYSLMM